MQKLKTDRKSFIRENDELLASKRLPLSYSQSTKYIGPSYQDATKSFVNKIKKPELQGSPAQKKNLNDTAFRLLDKNPNFMQPTKSSLRKQE